MGCGYMRKSSYLIAYSICFGLGAYCWRVKNSGVTAPLERETMAEPAPGAEHLGAYSFIKVGEETISQEDIEWEFKQHVDAVTETDALTLIPDLGDRYVQELTPLKRALIGTAIERKLLFAFLKRDHGFDYEQPTRYSKCLAEWQESVRPNESGLTRFDRDRLKARLCERSILSQYLQERLFAEIKIEERDLLEYYKNHMADFKLQEQVKIRHILAANEASAKTLKSQANAANFEALARQYSIAPEGVNGGVLGPFSKGSMPAVFEVAFHLKTGEISELLKSNYGYHIIQVMQHLPKQQKSFQEVRHQIECTVRRVRQEEIYGKWVEKALAAIDVTTPKAVW
ncbi:MAG: hypothetical protein FJ146_04380 [Deltaproteobacteria bacterium]|nr:hypothetical protein [Deltaproteobacteria bacterium]